jgi:hypothetical protein
MMNRKLILLAVMAVLLRIFFISYFNDDLSLSPDEERNYRIAFNHFNGHGYSFFNDQKQIFELTAFHGSFTVFVYEHLLIKNNIPKEWWVLMLAIVAQVLFFISIFYFYRLAQFFLNKKYAFYATITYCFYPSVLIYIGSLFSYHENIVLPLLIIVVARLLYSTEQDYKWYDYILIPVMVVTGILLKGNTLPVFAVLLFFYTLIVSIQKKWKHLLPVLTSVVLVLAVHLPTLEKNRIMFGKPVLSTQSGYEFLQGHHPEAKGSWLGRWKDSTNVLLGYVHENIEGVELMNELEEGEARKQLAWKWIKDHPLDVVKLEFRKLVLFFMPWNQNIHFTAIWYNPFNLAVHVLFLFIVFMKTATRSFTFRDVIILAPVLASLAVSVIFFVGYRWRFYAEPFMIIFAWTCIVYLMKRIREKRANSLLKND